MFELPQSSAALAAGLPPRFKIVGELGRGGMGVVFKAHDTAYGRDVAIKVLGEGISEAELLHRFRREGEDLSGMSHPNVVRFHEVGTHGKVDYIVMEYVDGGDLRDYLRERDLHSVLRAYLAICRGVDHIHSQGLVHRDIKPGNILFSAKGQPKITDFGISRRLDAISDLTQAGTILGSKSYVAPEQILSTSSVTPAADIYALGICFYESLAGRGPYSAESEFRLLQAHLSEVPKPPSQHREEIPEAVDDLVLRMLSKETEERPSARSAADDLTLYLESVGELEAPANSTGPEGMSAVPEPETSANDPTGQGHHLDVLSRLGHEIWTPMNGILGMTRLTLGSDLTADQRNYLQAVESSAEQLTEVLNTAFDYSRLRAGTLTLEPVLIDIRMFLEAALKPFLLQAAALDLELSLQIDPLVPDNVLVDPVRLRQILRNLLSNGLKFTKLGGLIVSVSRVSGDDTTVGLRFTVSDTGRGLLPGTEAEVFQAFYQEDASISRSSGGVGLGLAIVKGLVQKMHGRVWAESVRDRGSHFHFELPLGVGGSNDQTSYRTKLQNLKVLLFDPDEQEEALTEQFERWGLEVREVRNARAASKAMELAREKNKPFELVILAAEDDRQEIYDFISSYKPGSESFVILTSAVLEGDASRCQQLGVDMMVKPIEATDLWNRVLKILQSGPKGDHSGSRGLRILVAEDNEINQTLATVMLQNRGHHVEIAENGLEVLERLEREDYDLILMDLQMPKLDGLAATQRIREKELETGDHIPIVALTAHGDPGACREAGMDAFLKRPLDEEKLLDVLARLVGKRPTAARSETPSTPDKAEDSQIMATLPSLALAGQAPMAAPKIMEPVVRAMPTSSPGPWITVDLGAPPPADIAAVPTVGGVAEPEAPSEPDKSVLDEEALLARVGFHRASMLMLVDVFLKAYPQQLAEVREALDGGQPDALYRTAHTLKGSLLGFSAGKAAEAAETLAKLGKSGSVQGGEEAFERLVKESEQLIPAMQELKSRADA